MTTDQPFDLRSLGDIDSPELVRDALSRFRWRVLRNVLWGLLALATVGTWLGVRSVGSRLADEINRAPGVRVGAVYEHANMMMVLDKVVDLGDRVGLHLLVAQPGTGPQLSSGRDTFDVRLISAEPHEVDGGSTGERAYDLWYALRVPSDGRLTFEVSRTCSGFTKIYAPDDTTPRSARCMIPPIQEEDSSFVVDLRALGVPESVWQERSSDG